MGDDAVLLFHQGWTDIFNCLALIGYYTPYFTTLHVIHRMDATDLLETYCAQFENVVLHPIHINQFTELFCVGDSIHSHGRLHKFFGLDPTTVKILGHGLMDIHRNDVYKGVYGPAVDDRSVFFVDAFYSPYSIHPQTRIIEFVWTRNSFLEKPVYDKFVAIYGTQYSLKHGVPATEDGQIELGESSTNFLDTIHVLENAKSMILLDSVWAVFVYLLQAKYNLFVNTPITIRTRGHNYERMFQTPQFPNWSFEPLRPLRV